MPCYCIDKPLLIPVYLMQQSTKYNLPHMWDIFVLQRLYIHYIITFSHKFMQISTKRNIPEKCVALGLTLNSVKKSNNTDRKQVGLYQDMRTLISLAMSLFSLRLWLPEHCTKAMTISTAVTPLPSGCGVGWSPLPLLSQGSSDSWAQGIFCLCLPQDLPICFSSHV